MFNVSGCKGTAKIAFRRYHFLLQNVQILSTVKKAGEDLPDGGISVADHK